MFASRKSSKDGLSGQCRSCIGATASAYKLANKERLSAQSRDYAKINKEKIKAGRAEYYKKNRDHLIEYSARWRLDNPEKVIDARRYYYQLNREKISLVNVDRYAKSNKTGEMARRRKYYAEHRAQEHRYSNEYQKTRKKKDPVFALMCGLRSRISALLSSRGHKKTSKIIEIVGCTPAELKEYLEERFEPGMCWDNRADWHIDHIIPMSTAKTEEDVIMLNHYTNLQPLWAADNLAKSDKVAG